MNGPIYVVRQRRADPSASAETFGLALICRAFGIGDKSNVWNLSFAMRIGDDDANTYDCKAPYTRPVYTALIYGPCAMMKLVQLTPRSRRSRSVD